MLAAINFTLMPAAVFASTDSDLPTCCRKDGKHKCGMAEMEEASGPALRGVTQCPMFPSRTSAALASDVVGAAVPYHLVTIHITTFLTSPEQVEAQYRVSFGRSRQKRGPPVSSSI